MLFRDLQASYLALQFRLERCLINILRPLLQQFQGTASRRFRARLINICGLLSIIG
jgi:hypothetical protein